MLTRSGRHLKLVLESDGSKFGMVQHCKNVNVWRFIQLLKFWCFTLDHPFPLFANTPPWSGDGSAPFQFPSGCLLCILRPQLGFLFFKQLGIVLPISGQVLNRNQSFRQFEAQAWKIIAYQCGTKCQGKWRRQKSNRFLHFFNWGQSRGKKRKPCWMGSIGSTQNQGEDTKKSRSLPGGFIYMVIAPDSEGNEQIWPIPFHIFSQQFSTCVGSPRPPLTWSQHLTNHSTILPNGTVRTIQHISIVNIAPNSAKNVHPNPPLVRVFSNQGTSLNFQTGQSWVSERRSHQHTPRGRSDPIPPDSWFCLNQKHKAK